MTELLDVFAGSEVLEVGTGSGYQTAILSELGGRVSTVDIVEEFVETARRRLEALGYAGIRFGVRDGYEGWVEEAPFDRIMVTAGAPFIPDALVDQLVIGGRMVIPVGEPLPTSS